MYYNILVIFAVIGNLLGSPRNEKFSDNYNPDEPLYLTKYIESGNIEMVWWFFLIISFLNPKIFY